MSFLEHLEEHRGRLVRAVLGMLAGVILIVVFHELVVNDIIMGPRKADFITYRMFCDWSRMMGMCEDLCLRPPSFSL